MELSLTSTTSSMPSPSTSPNATLPPYSPAAFVVSPLSSVDELEASTFRLPQQYGAFSRTQNAPPAAAAAPHNSEAMKSAATARRAPK